MGHPKGLHPFRGRPWLAQQLEWLDAAPVGPIIVVLGYDHAAYAAAIPTWQLPRGIHLRVVVNPAPEYGPFSSIVRGAQEIPGQAAFVLPIDVPCPPPAVWNTLTAALTGDLLAAIPTHAMRGGHPVLLTAPFLHTLEGVPSTSDEARLDRQLEKISARHRVYCPVADDTILWNLNTPEDFAAFAARLRTYPKTVVSGPRARRGGAPKPERTM